MKQAKRKPFLNRKQTQSLLTTLKVITTTGALSLTIAGWSMLAHFDAGQAQAAVADANSNKVALVANSGRTGSMTTQPVKKLNVVKWVKDLSGNAVAVVRDNRGALWYVMGSDVPRLEQGLSPRVRPQLVQVTSRTRAS